MDIVCDVSKVSNCTTCRDVISYYIRQRQNLFENLRLNSPIVDIDPNCEWNLGKVLRCPLDDKICTETKFNKRRFRCGSCINISKLTNFQNLNNFPCTILQKQLKIREYPNIGIFIKDTEGSGDSIRYISSFDDSGEFLTSVCENYCTGSESTYKKCDSFTLEVILNWYLQNIIPDHIISIYGAFVCGTTGYQVVEVVENTVRLDQVPMDKMHMVLTNIFEILKSLEPYDFSVGQDINDVFVITKDYQVKLHNLTKCGLTLFPSNDPTCMSTGIRVYTGSFSVSEGTEKDKLFSSSSRIKIERIIYSDIHMNKRVLYKLNNLSNLLKLIESGVPFYRSSLNVYLVLLNLLKYPNFRDYIYRYEEMYQLFKKLWIPSEFKNLTLTLEDLEKCSLRCDALDIFYAGLKGS